MLKDIAYGEPAWEIATLFPPQGRWLIEDYLDLDTRTGNHLIEFSHGNIEVLPMPSLQHQAIATLLFHLLYTFVTSHTLGIVRFSPTKVQLWNGKIREPDLFYIANDHISQRTEQWFEKIDLAMEIVSPDDPNRDLETKRREYAQAGIPEYWVIDPRTEEILVLTLDRDHYSVHGVFAKGEKATSVLFPQFTVPVTEIFSQR
ncbi:MAG: Uma2 family endonuclease [Ardenticatenaceae bacterium]|nr:Uma2 family endonuclease [Ardenticatenaceae bacterium]